MKIAIGSDHAGYVLKETLEAWLLENGYEVTDLGTYSEERVDYPHYGALVGRAVARGDAEVGVAVCGSGQGICMAANKVPGVRAALCYDVASARNSREHNDANVLTLGGRLLTFTQAENVLRTWLATAFGGGRHAARVEKIMAIEQRIVASLDPAEQALVLRWMTPALPPAERAAWLGGARQQMPAEAFAVLLEGARAALNDTAWAKLARALGVAPVPGLVEV